MLKKLLIFILLVLVFSCKNDPIKQDRPQTEAEMTKQPEQMEKLAEIWRKYETKRKEELATPTERIDEKIKLINELQRVESIEAVGDTIYLQKMRFDSLWNLKQ